MPSEYNPNLNPHSGCVEERDAIDYIEGLLGENPSLGLLVEYQKRIIDAILELGAWDKAVAAIDARARIDSSALPTDVAFDEKFFSVATDIAERKRAGEIGDATEAHFQGRFRAIFGDDNTETVYFRTPTGGCVRVDVEVVLNEFGLLGGLRHLADLIRVTTAETSA